MWPSEADARASQRVVDGLRDALLETLARTVPPGSRVALVDFPNHPNIGDTAIWMGELAALRALGCAVVYRASFSSYSDAVLRHRLGRDGIVLLHGGGNFGDLWPTYHRFRERVILANQDRPVVQLPQTVHFDDPGERERSAQVLRRHERLTVLVRDTSSLGIVRGMLPAATVELCPDAAFALRIARPGPAGTSPLVLARSDHEGRGGLSEGLVRGARVSDWEPASAPERRRRQASRATGFVLKRGGLPAAPLETPTERLFGGLATERLRRGLNQLAAAPYVVTDRLHAHILSLLLGRPNVLLDNTYGKNSGFVEQWTGASPITAWADRPEAIVDALSRLGVRTPR